MTDDVLIRIAEALERMAPAPLAAPDFDGAQAFVWHVEPDRLTPVPRVNRVDIALLVGVDRVRDILLDNTRQFARGLPANNALLWGARGMGKSSLVKAVHAAVSAEGLGLKIVELQREDLPSVGRLLTHLRRSLPGVQASDQHSFANQVRTCGRCPLVIERVAAPETRYGCAVHDVQMLWPERLSENHDLLQTIVLINVVRL